MPGVSVTSCVDSAMGRKRRKLRNGSVRAVKVYEGCIRYVRVDFSTQRKRIRRILRGQERHKPVQDGIKIAKSLFEEMRISYTKPEPESAGCIYLIFSQKSIFDLYVGSSTNGMMNCVSGHFTGSRKVQAGEEGQALHKMTA